jgi:hypothetical protein
MSRCRDERVSAGDVAMENTTIISAGPMVQKAIQESKEWTGWRISPTTTPTGCVLGRGVL